jgi:hypothetical protein
MKVYPDWFFFKFSIISFTLALPLSYSGFPIDIECLQNRLFKICCVPVTSASPPRVSFFFSFLFLLQWPFTVLIKQTRQAVCEIKQSILRCLWAFRLVNAGNTKGGSITVPLTSCLISLESAA